jgi:hypothetical protein
MPESTMNIIIICAVVVFFNISSHFFKNDLKEHDIMKMLKEIRDLLNK